MRFAGMAVVVWLLAGAMAIAGNSDSTGVGSICGEVFCQETSEPIPLAIVIVAGTNWGVLADSEGCFAINGVRSGVYRVSGQAVGTRGGFIDSVYVAAGCTTYVQLGLVESTIEDIISIFTAYRDVLNVVESQTMHHLNSNELRSLPATDVYDILRKRGGVSFR